MRMMQPSKGNEPVRISGRYLLAYISFFLLLTYVYTCMRVLCAASLFDVFDAFAATPLLGFYLFIAAVGMTFIVDKIRRKIRKLCKPEFTPIIRNLLIFCNCMLVAFMLEITVFQYNHYGVIGADAPISTLDEGVNWQTLRFGYFGVIPEGSDSEQKCYVSAVDIFKEADQLLRVEGKISPDNLLLPPNAMDETYNAASEAYSRKVAENNGNLVYPQFTSYDKQFAVASFKNLNKRVASIHITPLFFPEGNTLFGAGIKKMNVVVSFSDEDSSLRQTSVFTIVDGLPFTEYIPIYPVGNVTEINICFAEKGAAFTEITLNEMIPLSPVLLRLLLVAGGLFCVCMLRKYDIFALKFNPKSKRQHAGFVIMVVALVAYSSFMVSVSQHEPRQGDGSEDKVYYFEEQYNYLAAALLQGHTWIDVPYNASELLHPYDEQWMTLQGIEYPHDTVMYDGKFYVYFGVVPAVLLFMPFIAVTGNYLPMSSAVWIVIVAQLIALSLLWREVAKRFLRNIPYFVFMLANITLLFCSMLFFNLTRHAQYEVATISAVFFVTSGLYALLRLDHRKKLSYWQISLSCLFFALAVGCRPTAVFWSVFVAMFVWQNRKNNMIKILIAVVVPYIVIAVPLMIYNYIRFGSITEFGVHYMISAMNMGIQDKQAPMAVIYRIMIGIKGFFFNPVNFQDEFPFVTTSSVSATDISYLYRGNRGVIGLLVLPVCWFLIKLKPALKAIEKQSSFFSNVLIGGLIISIIIAILTPLTGCGVTTRYLVDYAWIFVLSALMAMGMYFERTAEYTTVKLYAVIASITLIVSSGILLFISFTGAMNAISMYHPDAYGYLQRTFNLFGGI